MKKLPWQIPFGIALMLVSAGLFTIHYLIFHDAHDLFFYLLHAIATLPLEVLIVTLVLHRLLEVREKQALLHKLNMVIGAFFSEVGNELLRSLAAFDRDLDGKYESLRVRIDWGEKRFLKERGAQHAAEHVLDIETGDLAGLKRFLMSKRGFLLALLENPNLLEHETFTELLWAVFHLDEELLHRKSLDALPQADLRHLAGDARRAYALLIEEWLTHLFHLKRDYPYLFSLAVRINPFDPAARVEIGDVAAPARID